MQRRCCAILTPEGKIGERVREHCRNVGQEKTSAFIISCMLIYVNLNLQEVAVILVCGACAGTDLIFSKNICMSPNYHVFHSCRISRDSLPWY